jgi:hypothetical protein
MATTNVYPYPIRSLTPTTIITEEEKKRKKKKKKSA